ncbi:hypothetical protein CDD82_5932 [Ophiocordyceps australis]|uniref:TACO1/YebC-like second and third domain-containing protein n=1 Tax=Ophiocordyceps australis TaxID=1399860 RepID=A0A2C5YYS6_9HYPO|nr:hypothetical protein CDD82_5932 [Ophiocordyceps australis]
MLLAQVVAAATKASVPKSVIEAAIARGQGRSATGAKLEHMSIEVFMPPNIALMIDVETDSKTRTMADLRVAIKKGGGRVGSTAFYFSRRGRAVLVAKDGGPTLSDMLEESIELQGVDDVLELPDGSFLAWTEPSSLIAVTDVLSKRFELQVLESDIVWAPNTETQLAIDSHETVQALDTLCSRVRQVSEVKAIFANVQQGKIADEEWAKIDRHMDL